MHVKDPSAVQISLQTQNAKTAGNSNLACKKIVPKHFKFYSIFFYKGFFSPNYPLQNKKINKFF